MRKLRLADLAALTIGCSAANMRTAPTLKADAYVEGNRDYERAYALLQDKSLPKERNEEFAEALRKLYSENSCVGVGYDEISPFASNKASTEFYSKGCSDKEPRRIVMFKSRNGTYFCIFSNNEKCFNIRVEE